MRRFKISQSGSRPMHLDFELYDAILPFVEVAIYDDHPCFVDSVELTISQLDELIENLIAMRKEVKA